ncbi:hypothetical protein AAG906_038033 [Vitis piasezkii]
MSCFTYWLKEKVEEAIHNGQDIPDMLRWLAHGPTLQCDWVDNKNGIKVDELGFTLVDFSKIVLSIPPKDFKNIEGLDDFTDNCMEQHPFTSSRPEFESFDAMNES